MPRLSATLRDLVENPPGKASRFVAARYMIRDSLLEKYRRSVLDPDQRAKYRLQGVARRSGSYVVWVKVPSETYDVVYDVVFQLAPSDSSRLVSAADAKVYCNAPSWVMVLGYVANKNGLLPDGWAPALGQAAKQPPRVTNEVESFGFDKVVFKAVHWLLGPAGLISVADLERAVGGDEPDPKDKDLWGESKLAEYNEARERAVAGRRAEKAAAQKAKLAAEREAARARTAQARRSSQAAKTVKAAKTAKAVKARKGR